MILLAGLIHRSAAARCGMLAALLLPGLMLFSCSSAGKQDEPLPDPIFLPSAGSVLDSLPLPGPADPSPPARKGSVASIVLGSHDFDSSEPYNRTDDPNTLLLEFQPDHDSGDPLSQAAYLQYFFFMSGYDGPGEIHFAWAQAPAPQSCWVGLANYTTNRWQLLPMTANGVVPADLAGPDFRDPGGNLHIALIVTGHSPCRLYSVSLGDNTVPVPLLADLEFYSNPNEVVTMDASGSHDPDGTIAKFEFDPEGNGTYVDKGLNTSITHKYPSPGTYIASLRVTDNEGAVSTMYEKVHVSWQHTLAGPGGSGGTKSVALATNDGVLMTGSLDTAQPLVDNAFVARYDLFGNQEWLKAYDTAGGWSSGGDIAVAPDGTVYVTMSVDATEATATLVLLKLSAGGALQWQKELSGSFGDQACVALDSAWLPVLAVSRPGSGPDANSLVLMQLDTVGQILWQKSIKSDYKLDVQDICLDGDDTIWLPGYAYDEPSTAYHGFLIRCAAGGELLTAKYLGGSSDTDFATCCFDGSAIYLGGSVDTPGGWAYLLASYQPGGTLNWARNYTVQDGFYDLWGSTALAGGGCIVAGRHDTLVTPMGRGAVMQFAADGTLLSGQSFGDGVTETTHRSCALGPQGEIYLDYSCDVVQEQFAPISGAWDDFSMTLSDLPALVYVNGSVSLSDAGRTWADAAPASTDAGGAGILQYFPPTLNQ